MGDIKKVLALKTIEDRSITPHNIWADLCETIHLHYKNVRFDFSQKEWAHFCCAINSLQKAVEYHSEQSKYKEGDPNFLIHCKFNHPLKADSKYYPNRLSIEWERDNTVHVHYRDMRLHLSKDEFVEIANAFTEAKKEMDNQGVAEFRPGANNTPRRVIVPIENVQPYDAGHRPLAIDKEHREGIEKVKQLICDGHKIRPILINLNGQRLDGFKRYMAFEELGYKTIEVIIDPFGKMGGQDNQSWIDDEDK